MTTRIVISYLMVALFILTVLTIPLGLRYAQDAEFRLTVALERDASVVADLVSDALHGDAVQVKPDLGSYIDGDARIVIVDAAGNTVYDSLEPNAATYRRDYSTRPEIADALRGLRVSGTRSSDILGEELRYVAVPVSTGGVVHGAVRITYPTGALRAQITQAWLLYAVTAFAVLVAVIPVGVAVARWVSRPTVALTAQVARLKDGDLLVRANVTDGPPEVKQLAEGFNAMADRIGTLLTEQRSFASDASHQLRSPLTALRLEIEQMPTLDASEREDATDRAVKEIERLTEIVTALLTLARHDGTTELDLYPVDVATTVNERVAAWGSLAEQHDIRIAALTPTGTPITAYTGDGFLAQILDVLLENALDVSPAGSTITVTVTPPAAENSHALNVAVHDEGPGILPEHRERAFDRFWSGPHQRRSNRSGLGLAIARRLAQLAGGDITLEENTPNGTRAVVTMRARPINPAHRSTITT